MSGLSIRPITRISPEQPSFCAKAFGVDPPLSTMSQPLEEMGRIAAKKLLRSRDLGPRIMPHRRVERGSPAATATTDLRLLIGLRVPSDGPGSWVVIKPFQRLWGAGNSSV